MSRDRRSSGFVVPPQPASSERDRTEKEGEPAG